MTDEETCMNESPDKETWRPDERPDQAPTHPYDPMNPEEPNRSPIPLTPDQERPPVPGREPVDKVPVGDPPLGEPVRL